MLRHDIIANRLLDIKAKYRQQQNISDLLAPFRALPSDMSQISATYMTPLEDHQRQSEDDKYSIFSGNNKNRFTL